MESSTRYPLLTDNAHVNGDGDDRGIGLKISSHQHEQPVQLVKGGWKSAIYIIGVEVAERFAFYGTSGNLITYLIDVLGQSTAKAAQNVNIWSGVATLLPLLGAIIADSYLGRFNTIIVSSFIYIMGLVMLTLSVSTLIPLKFQYWVFFVSLYFVAIGEGGHKPCVQTFGAEQFDDCIPEEKKAKSSFFNWWYFGLCSGSTAGMLVVFYVQENVGWMIGFGLPAVAMAFALVIFLLGSEFYRSHVPKGSPLVRIMQVFVAAYRKRHLCVSKDGVPLYEEENPDAAGFSSNRQILAHTNQLKCLDKATIMDKMDTSCDTKNKWRLCSVTQVEEAKLLLRLVPIWLSCLSFGVVFAQGSTFFTKQGSSMDRTILHDFRIPSASLQVIPGLVIISTVVIYDRILVPIARNWTGIQSGITMLQRIGIGISFAALSMVTAALVEAKRVEVATQYGLVDQPNVTVPMSVCWLLPQYAILGVADVFAIVGLQEFFYDQMPDEMKSMGAAVYLSIMGVGSFLSSFIISIVKFASLENGDEWLGNNLNRAHLDYYYWLLAGLCTFGLGVYIGVSRCYLYKRTVAVADVLL
ncbi:protein NRT1/ PTR FAMILY 5.4-like [Papaver somniferum]|uniref:protein NRT1/ PTR FAMILY 5.4-like n=1 Tax=Papaver somniferum TaxID=3469 RepID=UPI000E6F631A|nr:protein NRT1/ PTR FAMILY 5.4-like [Papaver somniferum]